MKKIILDFSNALINLENVFSIKLTGSHIIIEGNCDRNIIHHCDTDEEATELYDTIKKSIEDVIC